MINFAKVIVFGEKNHIVGNTVCTKVRLIQKIDGDEVQYTYSLKNKKEVFFDTISENSRIV